MPLLRFLLISFLSCCTCAAQAFSIGVIGGGRVTDDVTGFHTPESSVISGAPPFRPESRFYVVGPAIEMGLAHGFSVEFDALYHRQGLFFTFYTGAYVYQTAGERDNVWEFPLLLKYRLREHAMNPFLEAGVTPRIMRGSITIISQSNFSGLGPPSSSTYATSYSPTVGFVSGGGVQFRVGHLRLAPQVRYTRWFTTPVWGIDGSIVGGIFASNLNQVDFLVGINWKLR